MHDFSVSADKCHDYFYNMIVNTDIGLPISV